MRIRQPNRNVVELNALPGLAVRVTALPPMTGVTDELGHECDDRSIDVANQLGSLWLLVMDDVAGGPIAEATFAATTNSVLCDTVSVHEDHRQKGIATALYDYAEETFGIDTQPSDLRSEDAKAFWAKRVARRGKTTT